MTTRQVYVIVAMICGSAVYADELVDRADANGDGFVSLYELRAAHYADLEFNRRIEQSFADFDVNGDGLISEDERRAKRPTTKEVAPTARIETPIRDTGTESSGSVLPDTSTVTSEIEASLNDDTGLSRAESRLLKIDTDNSGGASVAELVASGDGKQWFTKKAFESADKNGDRDLDPDELEMLLQSLERRRR